MENGYYKLGHIFIVLATVTIAYDNILLTRVNAEIWEIGDNVVSITVSTMILSQVGTMAKTMERTMLYETVVLGVLKRIRKIKRMREDSWK